MNVNILNALLIILVPLVPSIILFKYLRSKARVTGKPKIDIGPLTDIQVDLGGAFAGYFVTVIAMFFIVNQFNKKPYQIWTVEGRIVYQNPNQTLSIEDVIPTVTPETFQVNDDGVFDFQIVVPLNDQGNPKFPKIIFEHSGFISETLMLDHKNISGIRKYKMERDETNHAIVITESIILNVKK